MAVIYYIDYPLQCTIKPHLSYALFWTIFTTLDSYIDYDHLRPVQNTPAQ